MVPHASATADPLASYEAAIGFAECYGFQLYDGLNVAAAFEAGYATLFPEDLQNG
jgi:predicted nucleic acid-binding protein